MYLSDAIVGRDGASHPMLGLISGTATMSSELQALGYVEVETRIDTLLGPAGTRFRGHQFRYSRFDAPSAPEAYSMRVARTGKSAPEGYASRNVLASYVHAHWASNPGVAEAFVTCCERQRRSGERHEPGDRS
jgi:cobyrinic acid a,c-diamide synthase